MKFIKSTATLLALAFGSAGAFTGLSLSFVPRSHTNVHSTSSLQMVSDDVSLPLIDAAEQGRIEDIKSLLNDKSVDINAMNRLAAIHWASHRGDRDIVELLLDKGADIEARTSDHDKDTPLIRACASGHMSIVELLLDRGADIHAVNKFCENALSRACDNGRDGVVKLLLEHGANVNFSGAHDTWTPLHRACWNGHVKCVETLLCHDAEVDFKLSNGTRTPLDLAREYGYESIVNILEEHMKARQKNQDGHADHTNPPLHAYEWGHGEDGSFNLGGSKKYGPELLKGVDGGPGEWSQIDIQVEHSVGITPKGELYEWGNGNYFSPRGQPIQVESLMGKTVTHVCCGCSHTAVVTREGELFTRGEGKAGQLGHGNDNSLSILTRVEGLKGHFVSQVACGNYHTVVLTSDGCMWTFGDNNNGRTGHGITEGYQMIPRKVEGGGFSTSKKVVFITAGDHHSACITEDGSTYTWGDGYEGKLGHGDWTAYPSPKLVNVLVGIKAKEVACGGQHTLVCTEDGLVYSFGDGQYGQLGHGNSETRLTPTLICSAPLGGEFVVQVACGSQHSMALTSKGYVYTWGYGDHRRLGQPSLDCTSPYMVKVLFGKNKIVQISSSNDHSVALVDPKQQSYAKEMKAMVNDESCSDIVFVLENGDRVHAMKALLIGQSVYFQAMFRSNMRESRENEIQVRDCSKGVFLLLLEYLYTGGVDVGMDDALKLYVLADRYQVNELSRECVKTIRRGLTNENAMQMLVEVDGGLGLDAVKDACMSYVVSNCDKVIKYGSIHCLSISLMKELLIMVSQRKLEWK